MNFSILIQIDLLFIKWSEYLIIKNSNWKIYRNNSSEIIYEIFYNNKNKKEEFQFDFKKMKKIKLLKTLIILFYFNFGTTQFFANMKKLLLFLQVFSLSFRIPLIFRFPKKKLIITLMYSKILLII